MSGFVFDASVLIKTVVPEDGSEEAVALLKSGGALAPDLIVSECANILWKKTRRGEFSPEESKLASRILKHADFEIVTARTLIDKALAYAVMLDHPAYDCIYLAVALARQCPFVTADQSLINKLAQSKKESFSEIAIALADAPATLIQGTEKS